MATKKKAQTPKQQYRAAYCALVEAVYKVETKYGIPLALTALSEVLASRVEAEMCER